MNAVIYARYSSHKQTEQSIEGQLRVCHEYAAREGYHVVGEYIDRALTGRSDDRPEFQRMIDDAKKKQFQYVIVYKLDRFARNRYDSANYKHKLKQCGVRVLSAMEAISDNPESIILEAVLEASAEYYSVDLSQKIKRGRRESALKGKFIGGGIPFGYKSTGGELIIDEAKAEIVRYIFQQYANGIPKKKIIEEVNARGFRNSRGEPFSKSAFQHALKSEIYIGNLKQGEVGFDGACPALIDKATFEKVQERIAHNKHYAGKQKAKIEYLLTGKLFCGHCGEKMRGTGGTGKHGDRHNYYSCPERLKKVCNKKNEKKDFLEWYVVEQTIEYVLSPQRINEIAKRVVAQYDSEFSDRKLKNLEKMVTTLERELHNCVDAIATIPEAGRAALYKKIELIGAQKGDAEIDLAKLRIANGIRLTESEIVVFLKGFCKGDLFDREFRRRIIDVFINSVFLYDDRVIMYYNVKGGKQVSYIEMLEDLSEADDSPSPNAESSAQGRGSRVLILNDVDHHTQQVEHLGNVYFFPTCFALVLNLEKSLK